MSILCPYTLLPVYCSTQLLREHSRSKNKSLVLDNTNCEYSECFDSIYILDSHHGAAMWPSEVFPLVHDATKYNVVMNMKKGMVKSQLELLYYSLFIFLFLVQFSSVLYQVKPNIVSHRLLYFVSLLHI